MASPFPVSMLSRQHHDSVLAAIVVFFLWYLPRAHKPTVKLRKVESLISSKPLPVASAKA